MIERIRQVLLAPGAFFATLPVPASFPFAVAALCAVLESGASLVRIASAESPLEAMVVVRVAAWWLRSFVGNLLGVCSMWVIVRVCGGPLVHSWSVSGAALCPALLLSPLHEIVVSFESDLLAWKAPIALYVVGAVWSSVLIFMGVRVSAPRRALVAAAANAIVFVGVFTTLVWWSYAGA